MPKSPSQGTLYWPAKQVEPMKRTIPDVDRIRGERLKALRVAAGLLQRQVGAAFDIDKERQEVGRYRPRMRATVSAASRSAAGIRCPYRSVVVRVCVCPARLPATFGATPAASCSLMM